ncbi:hypothetical protein JS518_02460 [Clostridiales bacterium FE2010]|nr:hypothetical protein JS518_02460 [Clostridiales bacterium FE2010]
MRKLLCMVLCLCLLIPAMALAERKVVTALATNINPDDLSNTLVDARIKSYNKEENTITLEIIVPEFYDADEIKSLQIGDAIYTQGHEVTVNAINEYDCFIAVVQDDDEVITIATDGETVYPIQDGDDFSWITLTTVTVPVPPHLIFLDGIDPATGEDLSLPTVHSAEEFIAMLEGKDKSDPGFDLNNVEIVFDSAAQPYMIRRHYVVWQ